MICGAVYKDEEDWCGSRIGGRVENQKLHEIINYAPQLLKMTDRNFDYIVGNRVTRSNDAVYPTVCTTS